jgi:hypothetical protein
MHVEEKPLQHWIDHYYGYGSWQAPVWLIAWEEGGGDLPEEVAEKLNYFYEAHPPGTQATLCDIRELYRHATARMDGPRADKFTTLYDYRFGSDAILHGIWKNLIAFTYGFNGEELPDLLSYQKEHFASISAHREAFIQLYPLPSPHNHAWYYSWLDMPQFSFLKSRTLYEEQFYESRVQTILQNISVFKPEVVLMYDMQNINALKKSVHTFFPDANFNMVKGSKLHIPQHHRADFNGTTVLITTQTPALKHNRIETGFDWLEFGRKVRLEG